MATFGDPGFHVHSAMGQYLSLLAFHLLDDEVIPFNVVDYAAELRAYLEDVAETVANADADVNLTELEAAIDVFAEEAEKLEALKKPATKLGHKHKNLVRRLNEAYRDFQRGFVSQGGLPNREFYKHVVTAPGLDTGKSSSPLPDPWENSHKRWFQVTRPSPSPASPRACSMATFPLPTSGC
jgi:N-acetylated-alpha-linked acidic dipeptidase